MVTTYERQDIRLGDVVQIKHGWPFKSECFCEWSPGLPIVVSIGNFQYTGGFRFESTQLKGYRGEYPKDYDLSPGDILLVMTCQTAGGEILGIPGRIPNDGIQYLHNQRMGKVVVTRPDLIDLDYLYWVFLWNEFNQELVASSSGTKIVHTAPTRIEAFRFSSPPILEQRAIARILRSLDDKIELNQRMTRTLESVAQALFRSWFVDFEPVSAKREGRKPAGMDDATAALFPEHFQDTDIGPIPVGWKVVGIGDVMKNFDSKRIPLSGSQRATRPGVYPYYGAASVMDYIDDYIFDGVYLLVGEDGSVADNDGMAITQYVWGKFWVNNHAHVLQGTNGISTEHLLQAFQDNPVLPYVTGAVQPKLNQGNMNRIPFVLPNPEVANTFDHALTPIYQSLRARTEESSTLTKLRDTLLPQLLSGELTVGQAEEMIP